MGGKSELPLEEMHRPIWPGWLLAFLLAFALYVASVSPEILWQDAGKYEMRVAIGQLLDPQGLCRSHPLQFWTCTLLAKLLPVTIPFACGLVSALTGAATVANVFAITIRLTRRSAPAWLAAGGLALGNSFWHFSCVPGAHVVAAMFVTFEFWALVNWDQTRRPRWLVLMCLANGLALANHDLALMTLPVIGVVLLLAIYWKQSTWKILFAGALAWIAGAGIYLFLIGQFAIEHGLRDAIHSALIGQWGSEVAGGRYVPAYTLASIGFALLTFPNLMIPAAVLGIWRGRRQGVTPLAYWALLASFALHAAFVFRFNVIAQYTFLLPPYALMAIFSGIGFAVLASACSARTWKILAAVSVALIVASPAIDLLAAVVARRAHVLRGYERDKPYRDDYPYLFVPWARGEHSAQRMSAQAMQLAGSNGLIVDVDGEGIWAIQYHQAVDQKPGVEVSGVFDSVTVANYALANKPVVFIPFSVKQPPPAPPVGHWVRDGDMYILNTR